MARTDAWSATWACDKLISHRDIANAIAFGPNQIQLMVNRIARPVHVATMAVDTVRATDLREVCLSNDIEFAMNIKKDALFDQSAISLSESIPIGLGGLGDLYTAANEREFRTYLPKETRFILRGLRQHNAVVQVNRVNNRMYKICRFEKDDMLVLALNDYDLTADAVREGIDRFGKCDVILASNPNCRLSGESLSVGKYCGARILKWGQLLGAINN